MTFSLLLGAPAEILLGWIFLLFFSGLTCWSYSGYYFSIITLGVSAKEVDKKKLLGISNSYLCEFSSLTSGMEGAGFCSSRIKSCTALMTESVDENFGMINLLGKNSTVSEICSALVLGMYDLCNL